MITKELPNIAIVGATGAVGQELLKLFKERSFKFANLYLVASKRSAGKTVFYRKQKYIIEDLENFDFSQVDIAFFSAGTSISKVWARKAAEQGSLVIDNTNAFRMDADVPLVVPQVNSEKLKVRPASGIIANPNCSTIQMVRALAPIHRKYHVEEIVASTYQAASGGGMVGLDELTQDSQSVLEGTPPKKLTRFPVPLAFNVVPQIDVLLDSGFTMEEQKMVQETRKILDDFTIEITSTAVRVPVINGHSLAVYLLCEKNINREEVISDLKNEKEIIVYDSQKTGDYPTPRFLKTQNDVHVGRIRVSQHNPKGLWLWVVSNNLRIGAALNALQIAEAIIPETQKENTRENSRL